MQQSFALILIIETESTEAIEVDRIAKVLEHSTAAEAIATGLNVDSVRLRLDPKQECADCGEPADEEYFGVWYCSACIDDHRCRFPGCTEDSEDGEGFDGWCGHHADVIENHKDGEHLPTKHDECPVCLGMSLD